MEKTLSYIIPVYNGETTIRKSVLSAAGLSCCGEIIVVDDGSQDNTAKICEELQSEIGSRMVYIRQKNSGVSAARNVGLTLATGDYIGFIDADDEAKEAADEIFYSMISEMPDIIMFDYEECNAGVCKPVVLDWKEGKKDFDDCRLLLQWMVQYPLPVRRPKKHIGGKIYQFFYNRQFLKEHEILFPIDVKVAEDLCFLISCMNTCNHLEYSGRLGYTYYIFPASAIHRYRSEFWDELKTTYRVMTERIEDITMLKGMYYSFARTALQNYLENANSMPKQELYKRVIEIISDRKVVEDFQTVKDEGWGIKTRIVNVFIRLHFTWGIITLNAIGRWVRK